jgi:LmbE family N-acetylglucosaminyl deacetylase
MTKVLVVAPHADDESLGCGGTILRYIAEGHDVYWLLVTGMQESNGYTLDVIKKRKEEIKKVTSAYGFKGVFELNFPPAALETISKGELISSMAKIICEVKPEIIYTTYRNDAHSDHEVVYDTVMSSSKSFRYPFIKKVLAYETISETDFGLKPEDGGFRPNVFVNIVPYIAKKLEILDIFESEMGEFPFPRSRVALTALSQIRGVQSNCEAAEAFMLIKEVC